MKTSKFSIAAFVVAGLLFLANLPVSAQQFASGPEVFHDIYHDVSAPVSTYPDAAPVASMRRIIRPLPQRQVPGVISEARDQALQPFSLARVSATIGKNFDGLSDSSNGAVGTFVPSDDNIAVGATQVVETINSAYRVYNKSTGASVLGPKQVSSIFTGITGLCGQGATSPNFTDPIVLYDKISGRWIITILAVNSTFTTGNECIAVSSTSNAAGTYHRYAFSFGPNLVNDYPKFGVWPDAYYASYNMFTPTSYAGAKACAYNRAAMLLGTSAVAVCFTKTAEFSLLPSDLDGATKPPAGEPNFFVDLFNSTSLHLFKFHVDFVTTSKSTFTGPLSIAVASFTPACSSTSFTCIPQGGTTQRLDSLGDRLMFRMPYRNYATHESLVITHSVKTSTAASALRWYELRTPNSSRPSVFQQGTFGAGSPSLWMGSIAMDKVGNTAIGFSMSSSTTHPGLGYTGRIPTDPLGTMEALATIFTGSGSQTGGNANGGNRWGDYSSLVLDPSDDCTFWYVNQYIPANGEFNFHTRLASFKFPACM